MGLPATLDGRLRLPVIAAPMFIVSTPALVIAQCTAGIVGSFPALNARPQSQLDQWLQEIVEALAVWDRDHPDQPSAPFAVNQIIHRSNPRWEVDMATCERWRVPVVITSFGAREDVNRTVHDWGGITLHDITGDRFARKAIDRGADGLVAVAAGAGGHAGPLSPFALVQEIRVWFNGPLVLSGAIATGRAILSAQVMGADLGYIGSPFIATREANAPDAYKQAVVDGSAGSIVNSDFFTGVRGNFLRSSIVAARFDPDHLPGGDLSRLDTSLDLAEGDGHETKPWRDIWSSGQGIGLIDRIEPAGERIAHWCREYDAARRALADQIT